MILKITYNSSDSYIDTDIILYGYDDSGLNLVLNQIGQGSNPAAQLFYANGQQAVSFPSYSSFLSDTSSVFLECDHATYTKVNINVARIKRIEAIDSSNTKVYFEQSTSVDVVMAVDDLQAAINAVGSVPTDAHEDFIASGTSGVITLAHNYISGSWEVYQRGILVRRSEVSESSPNTLTLSSAYPVRVGDFLHVKYKYL